MKLTTWDPCKGMHFCLEKIDNNIYKSFLHRHCSELVVLAVFDCIMLFLNHILWWTLVQNVQNFPIQFGITELTWWTKIIFHDKVVLTKSNNWRDYKLVPSKVHDCQIKYKPMSHHSRSLLQYFIVYWIYSISYHSC